MVLYQGTGKIIFIIGKSEQPAKHLYGAERVTVTILVILYGIKCAYV